MSSIFLPKHVNEALIPRSKVVYGNRHFLCLILRQFSLPTSYYVLAPLKISPNIITSLSICSGIGAAFALATSNYILGAILMILWGFLDCCDGEVARYTERQSKYGAVLEIINSDLQYVLWLPALSYGLFAGGFLDVSWAFLAFVSCGLFSVLRTVLNVYPEDILHQPKSRLVTFVACQFKNMEEMRSDHLFASYFYNIWRNIITQQGMFELTVLIAACFYPPALKYLVMFYVSAYIAFVSLMLLSLLVLGFFVIGRSKGAVSKRSSETFAFTEVEVTDNS